MSSRDALAAVLERDRPSVIGFGEAHTPSGFTARPTVRRFSEDLLPILAPTSSALIVELLAPPSGCEAEKQATQREAEQVTQGQAETNQSDYLKLGQRSRELGVVPDILRASCGDMKAIADAGEEGVLVMMETIARLTGAAVIERSGRAPRERPRVLAYGGALHNDQNPRPERDAWSYAKQLREATHDRYVEIDLIVPELVADTPAWQSFAWFSAYEELAPKTRGALLLETAPRSYALVFAPNDGG